MAKNKKTVTLVRKVAGEPLVHFLAAGVLIFAGYGFFGPSGNSADSSLVIVDRDRLLVFMQQRTRIFQEGGFEEALDSLDKNQLESFIDEYVRDEVLYREAKALKLDTNDFTARQRLIQQLNFINQGVLYSAITFSNEELEAYLAQHAKRYRVRSKITFTHVYFSTDKYGENKSKQMAEAQKLELTGESVPFHKAGGYGDRFLYHRNYVNKNEDEIESHFGSEMRSALFASKEGGWIGPLRSKHGYHLALVTQISKGAMPGLDDVRDRVEQDARQDKVKNELEIVTQKLVEAYEIKRVEPIQAQGRQRSGSK